MEAIPGPVEIDILYFDLSLKSFAMQIFGALGLGLTILVLQGLVPDVFNELEQTALSALNAAQVSIDVATQLAGAAQAQR